MTRDEYIEMKLAQAKESALKEWDKLCQTSQTTQEGTDFADWVLTEVDKYAKEASAKIKEKCRLDSVYNSRHIASMTYSFLLHLLRRNCRVGSQLRTINTEDIANGKKLVRDVLELAASEKWSRGEKSVQCNSIAVGGTENLWEG